MPSELKRAVVRLAANYTRLGIKFILAVGFVPIVLLGVGAEGFGLVALLGSTMGIAEMCRAIVRASLRRELSAAYHSENPEDFPNAYNAAIAICAALTLITTTLFTIIFFILPLLNIPEHLLGAARWLVVTKGAAAIFIVLVAPAYNMYSVTERFVLANTWLTLDRLTDFLSAVLLFIILGMRDPAAGLVTYAWLSSGTSILIVSLAIVLIVRTDRRLIPNPSRISMVEIRKILPTAGWNTAVVAATNMHIRLDQFIMNFFGLSANAAFGVAIRLTSYGRVAAFGSTEGIDVVTARLKTTGKGATIAEMTGHSTRLHTAIAAPSILVVFFLAEPIIRVWLGWIGRAVEDPMMIPYAVTLSKILVFGMAARAINESWQRILYGAGYVREYGPWILLGGLFNPIIASSLIFMLPSSVAYQGPAWAYTSVMLIVNFIWMPKIAARCLEVSVRDMLLPLWKPTVTAVVTGPILLLPQILGREDSVVLLAVTLALFGGAYTALCWFYVLTRPERTRFSGAFLRRIGLAPRMAAGG